MKREEIVESLHSIHEFMDRALEILPKLSEKQTEINKVLSGNLTLINHKIIEVLIMDKKLEPLVAEQLLGILTTNNHELADALKNHNLLEQSRIELYSTLANTQKLYVKMCKKQLKKSE